MQPNFPGGVADGLVDKNPPDSAGDVGSIPELGRSPGEGNGNPLQYSCLGNPMDGGVWLRSMASQGLDRTHRLNNRLFSHFGSQPIRA